MKWFGSRVVLEAESGSVFHVLILNESSVWITHTDPESS